MKRIFVRFAVGLLALAGLVVWAFAGSLPWDAGETVIAGLALVVVGLAAYL